MPAGKRRCAPTLRSVQTVLDVSNEVAAELAGIGDPVLDALRDRLGCTVNLRGNRLTLAGDDLKVAEAQAVVEELVELVEGGQEVGAGTVDAILGAIDQAEDVREIFSDVVWSHRGKKITPKTVTQKRYVDAIRNCTVTFGIGPAGTGKTYLAIALAVAALSERQVGRIILTRPAVEAGGRVWFLPGGVPPQGAPRRRGGRAAWLPAGRRPREGRPVHAAALRRALRHDGSGEAQYLHGARHDRGRAARVHARKNFERQLRDPRRGAEHVPRADADVP